MTTQAKDFRAVSSEYDQDWVNGVGDREYRALFEFLQGKNIKTILDLAGGNGKLTKMLIDRGYDVHLFDIADNMLAEAHRKGVPAEKTMAGDVFSKNIEKKFDCIILKSSMHEIPLEKSSSFHSIVFDLLNPEGWFIDWDVHVPTKKDSNWLIRWVNIKDNIAGLVDLVKNRNIYTENFIVEQLKQTGFKKVTIAYRFFYTVSVAKMSKVYWSDNVQKTHEFFEQTRELLETYESDSISVTKTAPVDFEIKIPAVFIVGQK